MMKSKLKQFVAFGVCSFVALAICLVVLVVTVNNLESEQATTQVNKIESLTQLDNSDESLITYANSLIANTKDRFVKTKIYTDIAVNELVVSEKSENKAGDEALLNYVKDKLLPTVDTYYAADFEGSFKADNSNKLSLVLNESILNSSNYSIGQVNENGESVFDDEGNLVDNEFYYLTFEIDGKTISEDKKFYKMFSTESDLKAKNNFVNSVKDNCKIESFEAKPESFFVKVKVNRVTDKVEYINVIRNYNITTNVCFVNEAAFFGEKEISFIYTVTDTYEYSYSGISFVEDEVTIDFDEEYMLNVNAIIDNDSEYTVEFSSSDENIVAVDEMGYIKSLKKSDVPVTVTVQLKYLGKVFTDTCVVNISAE